MGIAEEIRRRIAERLAAEAIEVTDDSAAHAGHGGARPEGETHFSLSVISARFAGLPRVARQRLVYAALGDLMGAPVHALSLRTLTPDEAGR